MGCCCSRPLESDDDKDLRTPLLGDDDSVSTSSPPSGRKYDSTEETSPKQPASPASTPKKVTSPQTDANIEKHQLAFSEHLTQSKSLQASMRRLEEMYPETNTTRSLNGCVQHVYNSLADKSSVILRKGDSNRIQLMFSRDQIDHSILQGLDELNEASTITKDLLNKGPQLSKSICDSIAEENRRGDNGGSSSNKTLEVLRKMTEDLERIHCEVTDTLKKIQNVVDIFSLEQVSAKAESSITRSSNEDVPTGIHVDIQEDFKDIINPSADVGGKTQVVTQRCEQTVEYKAKPDNMQLDEPTPVEYKQTKDREPLTAEYNQAQDQVSPPVENKQAEDNNPPPVENKQAEDKNPPPVENKQAEDKNPPPVENKQAEDKNPPPVENKQAEDKNPPPVENKQAEEQVIDTQGLKTKPNPKEPEPEQQSIIPENIATPIPVQTTLATDEISSSQHGLEEEEEIPVKVEIGTQNNTMGPLESEGQESSDAVKTFPISEGDVDASNLINGRTNTRESTQATELEDHSQSISLEESLDPSQSIESKGSEDSSLVTPPEGSDHPSQSIPSTGREDPSPSSSLEKSVDPSESIPPKEDEDSVQSIPSEESIDQSQIIPTEDSEDPSQGNPPEVGDDPSQSIILNGEEYPSQSIPSKGSEDLTQSIPSRGSEDPSQSFPSEGDEVTKQNISTDHIEYSIVKEENKDRSLCLGTEQNKDPNNSIQADESEDPNVSIHTEESEDPSQSTCTEDEIFHDTHEEDSLNVSKDESTGLESDKSLANKEDSILDTNGKEEANSAETSSMPSNKDTSLNAEQAVSSVEYEMASEGGVSADSSTEQQESNVSVTSPSSMPDSKDEDTLQAIQHGAKLEKTSDESPPTKQQEARSQSNEDLKQDNDDKTPKNGEVFV